MIAKELFIGLSILGGYFLTLSLAAFILRKTAGLRGEAFRKSLHLIVAFSVFIFVYAFKTWWVSLIAAVVMIAIEFPCLVLAKKIPILKDMLIERKDGEMKFSLALAFLSFIALIAVCWGVFDQKHIITVSVLAWGIGDAAAALIGKRFGRHFISGVLIEGKKSAEGTGAMLVLGAVVIFATLVVFAAVPLTLALFAALVAGSLNAIVELTTKYGLDTISCPIIVAVTILSLLSIFL